MIKLIRNVLRNTELMWTILAQGTQLVAGVLLVKILTSQLKIEDYGFFALIMSVSAFILTVPFTALQQGFYRYRDIYNKKNRKDEFYSSMVVGVTSLIVIYSLIVYLLLYSFAVDRFWLDKFLLIALLVISEIYKIFTRSIVNADRDRKSYAQSIIVEFTLKCGLLLALTLIWKDTNLNLVLAAYIFANIISVLICAYPHINALKAIHYRQCKLIWLRVFVFSLPLLLWSGFGWLRDMSLRWFLNLYTDTTQVAMFTAITSIAVIIPMVIQSVIGAYFIPIMYANGKGQEREKIRQKMNQLMTVLLAIGALLFVAFYVLSDFIVVQLTDVKYSQYSWALPWMFISYYLFCCGMINATSLLVDFKPIKLFIPNLLSGLVILLSGLFVIEQYGIDSAIIAYCLSYLTYFFSSYIVVINNK